MASGATLFILKRIGNWKTSSFSFSKRATFTLQTAIIRLILKKVILWWNQKWFHQIESQFFWNHCGFTRYFELLGGIFFFCLVSTSKNSCFLAKIHHKQGFKKDGYARSFWKPNFCSPNVNKIQDRQKDLIGSALALSFGDKGFRGFKIGGDTSCFSKPYFFPI